MNFLDFRCSTGIWSECNRSEDSIEGIKKSNSPPPPVWTPKSAPQSPSVERKFRPVPFESPTLQRKRLPGNGTTPPPWTQPNYPDKPYQPVIIKSSSWNAISATPKQQQSNHIIYRKARGKFDHIHPWICCKSSCLISQLLIKLMRKSRKAFKIHRHKRKSQFLSKQSLLVRLSSQMN